MSAVTKLKPDDGTDLVVQAVYENPAVVYGKPETLDTFYVAMERKVDEFVPDLSTPTSRKKIASLAFEVAKTKTALDEAGKELNAAKRREIDLVDEARRSLRDRFDALRDRARQPLVDWENAEVRRKETCARDLADLREAGMIFSDDTLADLEGRLAKIEAMEIDADVFREFATEAEGRRIQAIASLKAGIDRVRLQEAQAAEMEVQKAELAKLRALQEERDRRDAQREEAERIQREEEARAAREKADRARAERDEIERQEREAERLANEEREAQERMIEAAAAEARRVAAAEERARQEAAEAAAQREREIEERHAAELRRVHEAQEAERREREAETARKEAEAQAEREAEERRQSNKRHRAKVMAEVHVAICEIVPELDERIVTRLVQAIAAREIVHTTIQF